MNEDEHTTLSGVWVNVSSTLRFRLLGFLPLTFFFAQALHYWRLNELGNMLWMCNIGNLLLALGLFFDKPLLIRVAAIWVIPGLAVWLQWVVLEWGVFLSSTLAHVGGIIVGMIAIRRVRMERGTWGYALGWYLIIQLLSRLITPAGLNVNVSHRIHAGWEQTFDAYWKFWLVLTVATAIILWVIERMLYRLWPPNTRIARAEDSNY